MDEECPGVAGFHRWIADTDVRHAKLNLGVNKHGKVDIEMNTIFQALIFIMDRNNQPVHVHCNQGKHRTGCVIGCLRVLQGWPVEQAIEEYNVYSGMKSRPGDRAFIRSFDPHLLFAFVKSKGMLGDVAMSGNVAGMRKDSSMSDLEVLRATLEAGVLDQSKYTSI